MTEQQEDYKVIEHETQRIGADRDDSFLSIIERLSIRPDIDVEKIRQIMDMQERVLDRNSKQAFNAAMTRAQNKIELVVAKEKNTQTGSDYADLKAILIKAKPVYTAEGFSLMFYEGDTPKEGHKRICVDIMHEGGHTEKRWGDFAIQTTGIGGKAMMTLIHGEGSAFSYGRRYLTCAIFNIPTGDDDGNAAGDKPGPFERWEIKCDKAAEGNTDMVQWWKENKGSIQKELNKIDAAKIYAQANAHKKRMDLQKPPEREPGSDDT